ncbi:MAG: C69 family dipeptidase [Lachnospiraceae bacterium]|nr:C69 family dipeptidase [Lachnospiraceae bacterium]
MSCTTVLVGKKASNDNSTMISRTDDGHFDVKKLISVDPKKQPKKYKCVESHLEIELKEKPMRYTASPNVDKSEGVWAATGINEAGVGMTATETITSNPRVLAADPYVEYQKAKGSKKAVPGGIGEEDLVVLVLPYIKTAREGVLRLASLLEKYGTYEPNGIAFNDENEVWWLETIGGHHWMARRVPDDMVVIAPNQFAMDSFDLKDALGEGKENLCSKDLKEFIKENHLDLNQKGRFNPRDIFGSHRDMDHIYNTPRAWFMGRYLAPYSYKWEGANADFTPESDNIPWALVPDRKVSVEDVKYLLSGHYQGTDFDPYINRDTGKRGMYRSIGINRTGVTSICQIRDKMPKELKGVEWICFGSTTFDAIIPVYTYTSKIPAYLSNVTLDASSENFYWVSRLIGALADSQYSSCVQLVERYQLAVMTKGRELLNEYDKKMLKAKKYDLITEANDKICAMAKEKSTDALTKILSEVSKHMKNGYNLADN